MANPEHLARLKEGVESWNRWRTKEPSIMPDLTGARLEGTDLRSANLSRANLRGGKLNSAKLCEAILASAALNEAELANADLSGASLISTNLCAANLNRAKLTDTILNSADLGEANLRKADLCRADLSWVQLSGADLSEANLTDAGFGSTSFGDTNLKGAVGMDSCLHNTYSYLDRFTVAASWPLPLSFLRGCGLSDWEIEMAELYDPILSASAVTDIVYRVASLRNSQPFEYHSCFISYSHLDDEFAKRLYADLQAKGVRCWFAPHDIMGGRKIHEQIDEAIRVHDKLLLILSEHSMASDWVGTEIANARERESREKKQMLFPITIAPFENVKQWKQMDGDSGADVAKKVRDYYIPDFSGWERDNSAYQKEFEKLVAALKAVASG
jgi:uncharacterized protein YjbI with pentapeptide repeats